MQFKVEKEFQQITNRQGDKEERIKKAADRLGWKAEWIKEGGGGRNGKKFIYII